MSGGSSAEEWLDFFVDAGIEEGAETYAITFANNRMKLDMLPELKKEYLVEMGITRIGHIIDILRHAKALHEGSVTRSSLLKKVDTLLEQSKEVDSAQEVQEGKSSTRSTDNMTPATRMLTHYMPKNLGNGTEDNKKRAVVNKTVNGPVKKMRTSSSSSPSSSGGADNIQRPVLPPHLKEKEKEKEEEDEEEDDDDDDEEEEDDQDEEEDEEDDDDEEEETEVTREAGSGGARLSSGVSRVQQTVTRANIRTVAAPLPKVTGSSSVFSRLGSKENGPQTPVAVSQVSRVVAPETTKPLSVLSTRNMQTPMPSSRNSQSSVVPSRNTHPPMGSSRNSQSPVITSRNSHSPSGSSRNSVVSNRIPQTVIVSNRMSHQTTVLKRPVVTPPATLSLTAGASHPASGILKNAKTRLGPFEQALPTSNISSGKTMRADQLELPVHARTKLQTFTVDNMSERKPSVKERLGQAGTINGEVKHTSSTANMSSPSWGKRSQDEDNGSKKFRHWNHAAEEREFNSLAAIIWGDSRSTMQGFSEEQGVVEEEEEVVRNGERPAVKKVSFGSVSQQLIPRRKAGRGEGPPEPKKPDHFRFLGSVGLSTGVFSRLGRLQP